MFEVFKIYQGSAGKLSNSNKKGVNAGDEEKQ